MAIPWTKAVNNSLWPFKVHYTLQFYHSAQVLEGSFLRTQAGMRMNVQNTFACSSFITTWCRTNQTRTWWFHWVHPSSRSWWWLNTSLDVPRAHPIQDSEGATSPKLGLPFESTLLHWWQYQIKPSLTAQLLWHKLTMPFTKIIVGEC